MRKNSRLPNLRNFGILLRVLLIVNILALLGVAMNSSSLSNFISQFVTLSTSLQPLLLINLALLYLLYPLLNRISYLWGAIITLALVITTTAIGFEIFNSVVSTDFTATALKSCLLSAAVTVIILYYFNLLNRAYSPAIAEARLQALQARIRPHFLFNSINAALSLIRSQPKQAETALEDMAELFRVLMAENRELVPLGQEISLCRQYLSIEKLRLQERLQVDWQIEQMPPDTLIPPLILQPLIENAVYHGIEPLVDGGTITISIFNKNKEVNILIQNPYKTGNEKQTGNKMAVKNIKERLRLHFDLEASVKSGFNDGIYEVNLKFPG